MKVKSKTKGAKAPPPSIWVKPLTQLNKPGCEKLVTSEMQLIDSLQEDPTWDALDTSSVSGSAER